MSARTTAARARTRDHHARLQQHVLEHDAMPVQRVEHLVQHRLGDFGAALERVVAVHQHFGLDDRHDAGFLADCRIARERVGVGFDRERGSAGSR